MSDDDDQNRVQVSVWVNTDQRNEWDQYADELGFESRAALIRNAVRYYYVAQTKFQNQKIINRLDDIDNTTNSIESKADSIKIDQLENSDIDILADEIQFRVLSGLQDLLGDVDSIEEIRPRSSDE